MYVVYLLMYWSMYILCSNYYLHVRVLLGVGVYVVVLQDIVHFFVHWCLCSGILTKMENDKKKVCKTVSLYTYTIQVENMTGKYLAI